MELSFKPDLDEALPRWRAFWNKEVLDRPCLAVTAPKDGVEQVPQPPYPTRPDDDFDEVIEQYEAHLAGIYFAGEAMPFIQPSFGPDQLAGFVGGRMDYSADSTATSWSAPFVESWEESLPLRLGEANDSWQRMLEFCRRAGRRGEGKFLVGALDLHSNFDLLGAIRDPARVCMDLLDAPHLVRRAMDNARELHPLVYNGLHEAGNMAGRGTIGWLPYFCEGRFATTQCDYACLLSPEQFNEYVLPALEEECDFVDRSVYHYDGAVSLQHFDAITGIGGLDGIQWVPGAGAKPMIEWIDLLKRFQAAGKNVVVGCSVEELKVFHGELAPNLVFYCVAAKDQREADEVLRWLEANT